MTKDETLKMALVALENVNPSLVCEMAHHSKKDQHGIGQKCPLEIRHLETIAAIKEALAQPVQEPVARVIDNGTFEGATEWIPFTNRVEPLKTGDLLYTAPPQQQAEPVAWDKPSASFNEWWDGDHRRDNANPFVTSSFSYWAWEGWQAALAQRPWVGLTDEEILRADPRIGTSDSNVNPYQIFINARAIEARLKEKNHG